MICAGFAVSCCHTDMSDVLVAWHGLPILSLEIDFAQGLCTSSVLEGLFAFKALQPHLDRSLVACRVHNCCLNLSHDDILLGEQKSEEAGDEDTIANQGGPADPIHPGVFFTPFVWKKRAEGKLLQWCA